MITSPLTLSHEVQQSLLHGQVPRDLKQLDMSFLQKLTERPLTLS